jgi:hypothetical protein
VSPVGPTEKENEVKMYKKYGIVLGTLSLETARIRVCTKQLDLDPYQDVKQDPDPDPSQSEKQDPDPS